MKQQILLVFFLSISLITFSQVEETLKEEMTVNQQDYYTKSENQKSAAWVLLGVGTVCTVGGILMLNDKNSNNEKDFGFGSSFDAQGFLVLGGIVVAAASIPFFISANRNKIKEKRAKAYFKLETIDQHYVFSNQANYPAVSVNIKF
jgi:hypothetical protein